MYTPGPLSEELGCKAVAIHQDCMDKLEAIAYSTNMSLYAILSHINKAKPPLVRNTSPWNVYAAWYNVEGPYEKPEDWLVGKWNKFVVHKYRKEVTAVSGDDEAKDSGAVREAMCFYIDWYKERLTQHLDKVKSNPKKAGHLLNKSLKPILHSAKQLWEDQGILAKETCGAEVLCLFARVKERSEAQVSRALEDITTLIHMEQMEGTQASACNGPAHFPHTTKLQNNSNNPPTHYRNSLMLTNAHNQSLAPLGSIWQSLRHL
ncbi:hypothetical protein V5O48_016800 [Marasmius crinis-equi]|uniref:Uncharacterized protein n=1 Tax=Marasmius crinis-equi TaxID=585013 RepID=A0ABR3EQR3_9AGAR